ncbi:MAG: GNAT family N-acetyltransferase, partial [Acidobacteriota bacterium]|nr:GNAT family N-acetyltransferase [Acidobacteriota bacterium]
MVNFNPFPLLSTERLTLREIESSDAGEMFVLRSNARVMRFIDRPLAERLEDAQKLIELMIDLQAKNDAVTWAITLSGERKMIGTINFWKIQKENYRAEIGY